MSNEQEQYADAGAYRVQASSGGRTSNADPGRVRAVRIPVWSYLKRKTERKARRLRTRWRQQRQPDVIRLGGVRIAIDRELYSPKIIQRLYDEGYEREERIALERTLRPTDRVLELGSGIGFLSALIARRIGDERVVTCEANPALIPTIRHIHELNGVEPTVLNGVMTCDPNLDSCRFYSHRDLWSSSLREPQGRYDVIDVPTLDWRDELDRVRPTYLLMDIEGGEIELLEALECASIERMLIEFHPKKTGQADVDRVFEHLASIGFAWAQDGGGSNIYYFER